MSTPRSRLAGTAVVLALVCAVAAPARADQVGTVPGPEAAQKLTRSMDASMTAADARMDLAGLTVAADRDMVGYDRALFPHWRDASTWGWPVEPNNACNVRNAALYWDGDDVTVPSTCTNLTGTWTDPYTGNVFDAASDIDIDHIVPLAEGWRSGAADWDATTRTAFANDPLNVMSTWLSSNRSKGDKDPTAWVPPNVDSHCLYANRWVQVKDGYDLTLTAAERDKVYDMLRSCGVTYDSAYDAPLISANSPAIKGGTVEADGSTTRMRSGSWVKLGTDFGAAGTARNLTFTYRSGVGTGVSGVLEVHRDGPEGDVIASAVFRGTGDWDQPVTVTVPTSGYTAGARSVYVTVQSHASYPVLELDSIQFGTQQQQTPGVHTYRYVKNGVPVTNWSNAKWMTVDGYATSPAKHGAWVALPSAWGTFRGDEVTFRYANGSADVGRVELRIDGPTGRLLAAADLAPTPADTTAREVTVPLLGDPPQGDRTVYAVFTGPAEETFGNLISYRVH